MELGERTLEGDAAAAELERLVTPPGGIDFETALRTRGILEQENTRRVLEASPADQFSRVAALLGLEVLEDFEDKVREYESETKSAEDDERQQLEQPASSLTCDSQQDRGDGGEAGITSLPGIFDRRLRYSSLADSVLVVEQRDLSSADHVARLRIDIEDLSRDLESYVASSSRVAELEREFGDHEIDDVVNNIDAEMREAETAGEKAPSGADPDTRGKR